MPDVLTVEETAQRLRISRGAAYAAVRAGEIPAIRLGRTLRVPARALDELLETTAARVTSPGGQNNGSRTTGNLDEERSQRARRS